MTVFIKLTPAEVQSGYDRVKWAAGLIRQLPENHDGRNSWLLNHGNASKADWVRLEGVRTALRWLHTLLISPAIPWNPGQHTAASEAYTTAAREAGVPAGFVAPNPAPCALPPPPWLCTRPPGHSGPCATIAAGCKDCAAKYEGHDCDYPNCVGAPSGLEAERVAFEAAYTPMGFVMTRSGTDSGGVDPWTDYVAESTGFAWAGWLARSGVPV